MKPQTDSISGRGEQTTLLQTAINFFNVLIGLFVLTMPFALKMGGVVVAYAALAYCVVAVVFCTNFLTRITLDNPSVKTYGDIAFLAFGSVGKCMLRIFLLLELLFISAAILLVSAQTLQDLYPLISQTSYALLLWASQFPFTIFSDRLSWLSWLSASGTLALIILIAVLIHVGVTKHHHLPQTNLTTHSMDSLELDIIAHHEGGLLELKYSLKDMAVINDNIWECFYAIAIVAAQMAALSVWPSMLLTIKPSERTYRKVSTMTTSIIIFVGVLVAVIGFLGYAIFNRDTTSVIMFDLLDAEEGYNLYALGATLCTMVVFNALSKYGLLMNPVMAAVEPIMIFFSSSSCFHATEGYKGSDNSPSMQVHQRPYRVGCREDEEEEGEDDGKDMDDASHVATGGLQRTASSLSYCSSSSSLKPEVIMTIEADNDDNDDKDMMTDERATSPSDKNRAYHHAIDGKKEGQFQAQKKKKKKKLMMRNFEEGVATIQLAPRQPNDTVIILEERKVETSNVNSSWTSSGSTIFRRIASGIMVQVVVLLVVLLVPEFTLVSALVGAALSTPLCILWPAACYVKLYWGTSTSFFRVFLVVFLALATVVVVVGVVGTVSQFGTIQFLQ